MRTILIMPIFRDYQLEDSLRTTLSSIILYSKYPYQNFDQIICYKSRDNGGIDLDIQFSNNSEIKNAI